jgi:L-fuculose-phosphate aldolase
MEGNQLSGRRKRTSEVLLHLAIMKERPDVKSVVHCHPPHATAFAIAREPIPQCVLPEIEVFLGETPITVYETPGGQKFADTVLPFVHKTNVMILANHGTVSYGETVERAYWWTEILDAYCRMLMMARDLGRVTYLGEEKSRELLDLKTKWGWKDPRMSPGMENCDICANDIFRDTWKGAGVDRRAFEAPAAIATKAGAKPQAVGTPSSNGSADQEAIIQAITDRVMAALKS